MMMMMRYCSYTRSALLCVLIAAYPRPPIGQRVSATRSVAAACLLKNPQGYLVKRRDVVRISVQPLTPYEVTVTFKKEAAVLILERFSSSNCDRCICWSELMRLSSRYGAKHTVTITPSSSELILTAWDLTPRRPAASHFSTENLCSTVATTVNGLHAENITICLDTPHGEPVLTGPLACKEPEPRS